jgi:predicted DNA-binding transcriptional regulator YafY
MPVNKNALLRYRIIDGCLTNPYNRYPTASFILEKIATQLETEISESMFNKDIQQMKRIYKAPIKYDRYHKGYCYTEKNFTIKEFPLTHAEIEALDYSTALLQQLKGTKMFQQFENAINKMIEGYRISKIIGKSENQILQVEEPVRTGGAEWLETLLHAIVNRTLLKIEYQGYGREPGTHEVSPYLLKEYRNRWYLIGHSTRRDNILVFALDRINSIETTKERYRADQSFSPAEFFKYSFGITQVHDAKPEKVVLAFNANEAAYIISQPLHHSQKPLSEEGVHPYVIELNVYITAELKMAILSFGKEVEVREPLSLRKELAACVKEMVLNYDSFD